MDRLNYMMHNGWLPYGTVQMHPRTYEQWEPISPFSKGYSANDLWIDDENGIHRWRVVPSFEVQFMWARVMSNDGAESHLVQL